MVHDYNELVYDWAQDANLDFDPNRIAEKIEYLTQKLFQQYTPTKGPHPGFRQRLNGWLNSAPDNESRKVLFQLVPNLFFIGREEFISLYHAAFQGPVLRWIIDQLRISLDDPNVQPKIDEGLSKTWFCPITDSMQIADFYHVNGIEGVNFRPDWCSLAQFADPVRFKCFLKRHFKRVVLFEDFIGSGSQAEPALNFAASLGDDIPFLVMPLVVCPAGMTYGMSVQRAHPNFIFEPVLSLPTNAFVNEIQDPGELSLFQSVRTTVNTIFTNVSGGELPDDNKKPYGPFGYRKTGSLVVMYTNTPNNTLPVVHWLSPTWPSPIFPRTSRI